MEISGHDSGTVERVMHNLPVGSTEAQRLAKDGQCEASCRYLTLISTAFGYER